MTTKGEAADPLAATCSSTAESAATDSGATAHGDEIALAQTIEGPHAGLAPGVHLATGLTSEDPGRYERADELGRGGMGRVVLAIDRHLGREVAMKELLGHVSAADSAMSVGAAVRFLREARITGQLEHPSIVPVHELGQREDGTIYYTMKRIRGRSLAHALRDSDGLAGRLGLIGAFRAACDAVAYAHSRGVVHRDLKPDNVMVGEFGETLVVDWGLAKIRGEAEVREIDRRVTIAQDADAASTIDGHALGTPAYMSPEQARGELESIDERSDVWGLGAMLYEILTGRPPYAADSVLALVNKVLTERPPRVRELCPQAPPELVAIAERALSRDPSSRYPGAKELAAEIAAWQDGRTVRAYEYSSVELARRFFARNRAAALATAVVLFAILGVSLLAVESYGRERRARTLAEQRGDQEASARELAETSATATRLALAEVLVGRAERALRDGDLGGAAVLAANALANDPAYEARASTRTRQASERIGRAKASLIRAYEQQRYVFARELPGVRAEAELSPDGRTIVFATPDQLSVVEVETGERREQAAPGVGAVLAVLDAERVIASGGPPGVFSVSTGERLLSLDPAVVAAEVRGDRVATVSSGGEVVFYDRGAMTVQARASSSIRGRAQLAMTGPDAVVIGSREQTFAERVVIDAAPIRLPLRGAARAIAASRHDEAVAVVLDDSLAIFDRDGRWSLPVSASSFAWLGRELYASAEDGERVVVRRGDRTIDTLHPSRGLGHRVIGAGRTLLAIAHPRPGELPSASVFRAPAARGGDAVKLPSAIGDAVVDRARDRIVVAAGDGIWAVASERDRLGAATLLARLPEAVAGRRLVVLPDGAVLVQLRGGRVGVLEAGASALRVLFTPSRELPHDRAGLGFDAEHDIVLAADAGGEVARIRRDGTHLDPLTGHDDLVTGIAVSQRGMIATASLDGSVRLFAARGGGRLIERHDALSSDVAFSPDGARVATADGRGVVRVRDAATGESIASWPIADGWIERVVWSDDGRFLVVGSEDRVLRVIDAASGALVRRERPRSRAHGAWLTPDSGRLVYADGRRLLSTAVELPVARRDAASLVRWAVGRAGPGAAER